MTDGMAQAALHTANEAMRMAAVVKSELAGHEANCGRRYEDWRAQSGRTEKAIESVHDKIDLNIREISAQIDRKVGSIYKILWGTSATSIILLITGIATLAFFLLKKAFQ